MDLLKKIAAELTELVLLTAAEDENEEVIKLVKKPGKKGNRALEISVHTEICNTAALPYYVAKIIESAAKLAGTTPEKMAEHSMTFLKLTKEDKE